MSRRIAALAPALALAIALVPPAPLAAADLEGPLNARFRGSWAVVLVPVASDCGGLYTDNRVLGSRTDSSGRHRFAAGELVRVERVAVRRGGRVDVFLDLAEQILAARTDGPFTLYDPLSCKVQLEVAFPREAALAEVEAALGELLEEHDDPAGAEDSEAWNGRRREDYPEGYEETLAAHAAWRAEEVNRAVDRRIDEALDQALRLRDRVREDPDYLAGLAAGLDRVRDDSLGDCARLVDARIHPETERGESAAWNDGYADGQRLAFELGVARALRRCYVAPPLP